MNHSAPTSQVDRYSQDRAGQRCSASSAKGEGPRRLWVSGETARNIAEKLGGAITRNAVTGKAYRLGPTGKHGNHRPASKHREKFVPQTRRRKSKAT